jgi:hypothetical protein
MAIMKVRYHHTNSGISCQFLFISCIQAKQSQLEASNFWNEAKREKISLVSTVKSKIKELERRTRNRKGSIEMFVQNMAKKRRGHTPEGSTTRYEQESLSNEESTHESSTPEIIECPQDTDAETLEPELLGRSYSTPRQDNVREELHTLKDRVKALKNADANGLLHSSAKNELKLLLKKKESLRRKLVNLRTRARISRRVRNRRRRVLTSLKGTADFESMLKNCREFGGRPRLEDEQPLLLKTIVDLLDNSVSADGRRRTRVLRSCRTLDSLHRELLNIGISLMHA